jgi:hypothetical protein
LPGTWEMVRHLLNWVCDLSCHLFQSRDNIQANCLIKLDPEETDPRKKEPWLYGASGEQVTPSVKDLPVEEGNALRNNAKRFRKVRYALDVVLEAIENPDDYLELDDFGEHMKGLGDRIDDL